MALQKVCELAELVDGAGREFIVGEQIIALFRTADRVYAVDGMCAHQGGPLAQGTVDAHCVTCPWHGWQYDVRSGQNMLTGKRMLNCFTVEIRGDEVWLDPTSSQ